MVSIPSRNAGTTFPRSCGQLSRTDRRPLRPRPPWLVAGALLVAACTGEIPGAAVGPSGSAGVGGAASSTTTAGTTSFADSSGTTTTAGTTTTSGVPGNPSAEGTSLPYTPPSAVSPTLEARTWKLTHAQYQASIEALFGVQVALEDADG